MCPNCGLPQPTVYIEEPFVRLSWREDVLINFFGADVVGRGPESETAGKKRRRRSTKDEESPEKAESPQTEEDRLDLERRRGEYEFYVLRPFTNWDALNVLRSITRSDLAILGIDGQVTHPEGSCCRSLLVPAAPVRPTVSFEEGSASGLSPAHQKDFRYCETEASADRRGAKLQNPVGRHDTERQIPRVAHHGNTIVLQHHLALPDQRQMQDSRLEALSVCSPGARPLGLHQPGAERQKWPLPGDAHGEKSGLLCPHSCHAGPEHGHRHDRYSTGVGQAAHSAH